MSRKRKWECLPNCGWCCGQHLKFAKALVDEHKRDFQVTPDIMILTADGLVNIGTEDGQCVWMNRTTKRCSIYKDRPIMCRVYGIHLKHPCPFVDINGKKRSQEEIAKNEAAVNNAARFVAKYMCKENTDGTPRAAEHTQSLSEEKAGEKWYKEQERNGTRTSQFTGESPETTGERNRD